MTLFQLDGIYRRIIGRGRRRAGRTAGPIRRFNDYPMAFHIPAFSPRAVDYPRDLLGPNGELLPVQQRHGIYYPYNRATPVNRLDPDKSTRASFDGMISSIMRFAFQEHLVKDLSFSRIRPEPLYLCCAQVVADRVRTYGLNGFVFVKPWSSEEGPNGECPDAMVAATSAAEKIKLDDGPAAEVEGNAGVIRLYAAKKKATKAGSAAVERIMDELDGRIYDPDAEAEGYWGSVEGRDVVRHEVRIFLSCPDRDRRVGRLLPCPRALPWAGPCQVVKRYGECVEVGVREEYARLG